MIHDSPCEICERPMSAHEAEHYLVCKDCYKKLPLEQRPQYRVRGLHSGNSEQIGRTTNPYNFQWR